VISFRDCRPEIIDWLPSVLSGSPHDFVRRLNIEADRALWIDSLCGDLPPEDDLRLIVGGGEGRIALFAERLPWDSSFFGYGVARLNWIAGRGDTAAALNALCETAQRRGVRYLFTPIPPTHLSGIQALCAAGFTLIETRHTYHRDLAGFDHPRYPCRVATVMDIPTLAAAAREAVNPFDRFHADPFLRRADVDRLMETWVEASLLRGFADVTIVPDVPHPQAFTTVRYHRDRWEAWGVRLAQAAVLTAVAPEFRGWYRKLITEITHHLIALGVDHAYLTTQITNGAVIHVLEGLGYHFGKGEHIFRVIL